MLSLQRAHTPPPADCTFPFPFSLFFPHRCATRKIWRIPRDLQPGKQWAVAARPDLTPWICLQGPFSLTSQWAKASPPRLSCCCFYTRPFLVSLSPALINVLKITKKYKQTNKHSNLISQWDTYNRMSQAVWVLRGYLLPTDSWGAWTRGRTQVCTQNNQRWENTSPESWADQLFGTQNSLLAVLETLRTMFQIAELPQPSSLVKGVGLS